MSPVDPRHVTLSDFMVSPLKAVTSVLFYVPC